MEAVETLFKGGERMRENDGGANLTQIHCMHTWKCHNETPCTTYIC
jgi:hypothetical protein